MAHQHTFLDRELQDARNRSHLAVQAFLEDVILGVEARVQEMERQDGILAQRPSGILHVNVDSLMRSNNNEYTPIASNIRQHEEETRTEENSREGTGKFSVTMSDDAVLDSVVAPMTEAAQDMMFELGYNSNGKPPFFGNMMEERAAMEEYNEDPCPTLASLSISSATTTTAESSSSAAANEDEPQFIPLSDNEINKMVVDKLKKELRLWQLSTNGLKAALQARLKKAMESF